MKLAACSFRVHAQCAAHPSRISEYAIGIPEMRLIFLTDPRSQSRPQRLAPYLKLSLRCDQGSVGDCGPFRYRQFERVSEIPGIPATHTVPTLFPNQFVPGCELIPGPIGIARAQLLFRPIRPGISSSCACVWVSFNLLYTTTRSCPNKLETGCGKSPKLIY